MNGSRPVATAALVALFLVLGYCTGRNGGVIDGDAPSLLPPWKSGGGEGVDGDGAGARALAIQSGRPVRQSWLDAEDTAAAVAETVGFAWSRKEGVEEQEGVMEAEGVRGDEAGEDFFVLGYAAANAVGAAAAAAPGSTWASKPTEVSRGIRKGVARSDGGPGWPVVFAPSAAERSPSPPHDKAVAGAGARWAGMGAGGIEREGGEVEVWRGEEAEPWVWSRQPWLPSAFGGEEDWDEQRQGSMRGAMGVPDGQGGGGGGGRSLRGSSHSNLERCFLWGERGEKETQRCHANVYFFGISKCGTTSLAQWMTHHPQLRWVTKVDSRKSGSESHVLEYLRSKEDFARNYPRTAPEAWESNPVIDYTPHYSIMANVPYKILSLYGKSAYNGDVKYMVLLREPVARTVSSWQFKYDMPGGKEPRGEKRTLAEVFAEGKRRVGDLLHCQSEHRLDDLSFSTGRLKVDLETCNPKEFLESNDYLTHVGKSMYYMQLKRWFSLFGQENIKVIFLEDMAADPVETLSEVFSFLGVDLVDVEAAPKGPASREDWEEIVSVSHNPTHEQRKQLLDKQVTPELVQSMRTFFAPHNAQLQELLGRPLPESWSLPKAFG